MSRSLSSKSKSSRRPHTVSHPHDAAERQADKAADVVARGGSVSGWSFSSVRSEAGVHRDEKPKGDDEKYKEAAKKVGEAALETDAGKELTKKVQDAEPVKAVKKALETTPGKIAAGVGIAGGVAGLAAAKQPLPFQAPGFEIKPGIEAKITVEGPLNAPTFAGVSLTFKEQGPKSKGGPTEKEKIAAETARLRAQQQMFKPAAQKAQEKAQEKADEDAAIAHVLAQQSKRFGASTLLPVKPADKPKTVEAPKEAQPEERKTEESPVQREPASQADNAHAGLDTSGIEGAVRGGGRGLEPSVRRSMEARFGYDFGSVRIHDDAQANAAAAGVESSAFTVGEDVVFASGRFDVSSPAGRHLLAHELAHVVQQRGQAEPAPHRRSIFESIGILLGLEEGHWTDQELHAYLDSVTASGKIDGSYDADNKARAIVRRWKAASPGFDLTGKQKALLIDEMQDGPTYDDDEQCILDLLELSDASDLRAIFATPAERITGLDGDLQGDEQDRLDAFVASRFDGGRDALKAGRVEVVGDPVPKGAPRFAFSAALLEARFDSDRSAPELIALIDHFGAADRKRAVDHLLHVLWPKLTDRIGRAGPVLADDSVDEQHKSELLEQLGPVYEGRQKVERVLQHYFFTDVPATAEELRKSTKAADPGRREKLREVLLPVQYTPQPKPEGKKPDSKTDPEKKTEPEKGAGDKTAKAKFHDEEKYKEELTTALPTLVDDIYKRTVIEKGSTAPMDEVEALAVIAKRETDKVFGAFYSQKDHKELTVDRPGKPGKLTSAYAVKDKEFKAMGPGQKRDSATAWVLYYFQSQHVVRLLNDKYAAQPKFDSFNKALNKEAKAQQKVAQAFTAKQDNVRKLNETERSWGGFAGAGGKILVDLFHNKDETKDRLAIWDTFQTLVHEYLHTLVHKKYEDYAMSFGPSSLEWNTLIEGVDCVLAEVVWAALVPRVGDPALRKEIEGAKYATLDPIEIPWPSRYDSYPEAVRLVEEVGIRNVYAAYFLGLVDRISAPKGKGGTK